MEYFTNGNNNIWNKLQAVEIQRCLYRDNSSFRPDNHSTNDCKYHWCKFPGQISDQLGPTDPWIPDREIKVVRIMVVLVSNGNSGRLYKCIARYISFLHTRRHYDSRFYSRKCSEWGFESAFYSLRWHKVRHICLPMYYIYIFKWVGWMVGVMLDNVRNRCWNTTKNLYFWCFTKYRILIWWTIV